jgi:thioester reductase-like protein
LITGADGYLGYSLVKRYLTESDARLSLLMHARNNERANEKSTQLFNRLDADLHNVDRTRVALLFADLGCDDLPAPLDSVDCIIHAAAITRFNVESELAQSVNIDGTRRIMELARRCPRLEKVCQVSSIYASGLKSGSIPEGSLDDSAGFANHYERSKCAAEQVLTSEFSDLPWQICRVGMVMADNETGNVSRHNAVHNTLKLFYYGLLSIVPGNGDTPLYFVTGDYATNALMSAVSSGATHSFFNMAHRRDECISLDDFVETALATFNSDDSFKRRNVLKPLYSQLDSFETLCEAMTCMGKGIVNQAAASIRPFARQLYIDKDVCNNNASQLLPAYQAPDAKALTRVMCDHLVKTKWNLSHEPITLTR